MRRPSLLPAGAAAVLCVLSMAACAPTAGPEGSPSASVSSPATPTATATPSETTVDPDGAASANLPVFTAVMNEVWKSDDDVRGRAYIDALVDVGFSKDDMEVTRDKSTVGIDADSIQFSVRWKGECLVGQVGPSTKRPTALVLPELPDGRCLVGETRPIDW